jgi:hypothetical protein
MSGGGVWHLTRITKNMDKILWEATDLILSGVIFYEYYDPSLLHNRLSIKAHGRQSIYKNAIDCTSALWDRSERQAK